MKQYDLAVNCLNDDFLRASFNRLAGECFGISFEDWYQAGWAGKEYIPYSLVDSGKVIANVSVNRMKLELEGKPVSAIQLGTVMTDPDYRKQGLSRQLMERILMEYEGQCDFIYLFANQSVLDFYPKFGFRRMEQYDASIDLPAGLGRPAAYSRRLRLEDLDDRKRFLELAGHHAAAGKISMLGNLPLLMFYCDFFEREHLYDLPGLDATAVAEWEGDTLLIHDVFSRSRPDMMQVVSALAHKGTKTVRFGFTPADLPCQLNLRADEDDVLFVRSAGELILPRVAFPMLSHA